MKHLIQLSTVIGTALVLGGCASHGHNPVNQLLQQQNSILQQQNAELRSSINELNETINELSHQHKAQAAEAQHEAQHENTSHAHDQAAMEPTRVRATGYGAEDKFKEHTAGQRRLLAIRAAKMDAFRSLAEAVRGFNISGETSVSGAVTESDIYKSDVEAFIRGAQVTDITELKKGTYQVTVELVLDKRFFECLDHPQDEKCRPPKSNKAYFPGFAS